MATVLVVDDEPVNRLLMRSMLSHHLVHEAASAEEAHVAVATHRPQLIILDLSLPEANGFDVLKRLRADGCVTPVLLYTATRPDATMTELASLYGASGFLPKPGEPAEVIALVEATIAN